MCRMMVSDASNSTPSRRLDINLGTALIWDGLTDGQMRKPFMDSQYVSRYMKRRCVRSFQRVVRDEVVIARNALHQVVSKQRYEHKENLPSTPVPEQTDSSIYTPVHRSPGTDAKATYSKKMSQMLIAIVRDQLRLEYLPSENGRAS